MSTKLRNTYTFRPEDLIKLLHDTYVYAYITAIMADDEIEDEDAEPVPMDKNGPETNAWVNLRVEDLKRLKRRKDGTFYQARVPAPPLEIT